MEQDLNFLADEIARFYTMRRRKELGENIYTPTNAKYTAAFKAAAEICAELDAEPEVYVISQFAAIDPKKLATVVNFLHTENVKIYYNRFVDTTTLPYEDWHKLQIEYLKDQVELVHRPVVRALMDDNLNFKPWFRICITKEPNQEIIDKYGEEAREMYQADKRLREFLAKKNLDHKRFTND